MSGLRVTGLQGLGFRVYRVIGLENLRTPKPAAAHIGASIIRIGFRGLL